MSGIWLILLISRARLVIFYFYMVYLTFSVLKLLWLAFTSFSIFYERNELPLDLRCSLPPFASVLRNKKGIKQEKLCQSNRICKEKLGFKGCTGQLSS